VNHPKWPRPGPNLRAASLGPTTRRSSAVQVLTRAVLLPVACLVIAGCSGKGAGDTGTGKANAEDALGLAVKTGVVRVGFANEAPYAYMDNQTGRLTGEAPEVARVILGEMGIHRIVGVLTEFGSLIPGLQAHRFDLIAAGMYILPQRCKQIAFANPTYSMGDAFLVRVGNPKHLHGYGYVVRNHAARLGVVVGTVEQRWANELGVPADRLVIFPDTPSALAGVQSSRVDAFAGTSLTVRDLLKKVQGGVEEAQPFSEPVINGRRVRGFGAFGFRKSDNKFRTVFNKNLEKFIGTAAYFKIIRRFGFTRDNLPGRVTAKELCQGH
jgi:polar amino acid transport system substrate-binding protein